MGIIDLTEQFGNCVIDDDEIGTPKNGEGIVIPIEEIEEKEKRAKRPLVGTITRNGKHKLTKFNHKIINNSYLTGIAIQEEVRIRATKLKVDPEIIDIIGSWLGLYTSLIAGTFGQMAKHLYPETEGVVEDYKPVLEQYQRETSAFGGLAREFELTLTPRYYLESEIRDTQLYKLYGTPLYMEIKGQLEDNSKILFNCINGLLRFMGVKPSDVAVYLSKPVDEQEEVYEEIDADLEIQNIVVQLNSMNGKDVNQSIGRPQKVVPMNLSLAYIVSNMDTIVNQFEAISSISFMDEMMPVSSLHQGLAILLTFMNAMLEPIEQSFFIDLLKRSTLEDKIGIDFEGGKYPGVMTEIEVMGLNPKGWVYWNGSKKLLFKYLVNLCLGLDIDLEEIVFNMRVLSDL